MYRETYSRLACEHQKTTIEAQNSEGPNSVAYGAIERIWAIYNLRYLMVPVASADPIWRFHTTTKKPQGEAITRIAETSTTKTQLWYRRWHAARIGYRRSTSGSEAGTDNPAIGSRSLAAPLARYREATLTICIGQTAWAHCGHWLYLGRGMMNPRLRANVADDLGRHSRPTNGTDIIPTIEDAAESGSERCAG